MSWLTWQHVAGAGAIALGAAALGLVALLRTYYWREFQERRRRRRRAAIIKRTKGGR